MCTRRKGENVHSIIVHNKVRNNIKYGKLQYRHTVEDYITAQLRKREGCTTWKNLNKIIITENYILYDFKKLLSITQNSKYFMYKTLKPSN